MLGHARNSRGDAAIACGCSKPVGVTVKGRNDARYTPRQQAAAAMCTACTLRAGEDCSHSERSVLQHAKSVDCPIGQHPNSLNIVAWPFALFDWYGVPYPIRLWLWATRRLSKPSALAGCGCIVSIKKFAASLDERITSVLSLRHRSERNASRIPVTRSV